MPEIPEFVPARLARLLLCGCDKPTLAALVTAGLLTRRGAVKPYFAVIEIGKILALHKTGVADMWPIAWRQYACRLRAERAVNSRRKKV